MSPYSSDIDVAEAELQQELREMFTVDTQQHLEIYFSIIQQLNSRSWAADIQHLYRAVHTIKGGAVTVAADAMLHVAIVLEDLLGDLRYLEIAPPLADRQLTEILLEAGELLSSSIEIDAVGDLAIELVQPTVQRLQQLRALVKQLYLPDWNELKQVHQEFADQGFDLVTLELEMALANIPIEGIVPQKVINLANSTIDQLTQIGRDLELAEGWTLAINYCQKLINRSDCQLWRQVWLKYFQILKICVKNSGKISQIEIDLFEDLSNSKVDCDTDNLGEELDNLFDQEPSQIIDGHHFANISTNLQAESPLVSSIDTDNLGEELDNLFDQEPSQIIDGHHFANISTNLQAESPLVSIIDTDNLGEELDNLFDQEPSQIIDGHHFANISTNLQAESSLVSSIDTDNLGEELDNLFDHEPSQIIDDHHFANISTNLQAESSLVSSIDTDNLGEELDNLFDQEPSQIIDGHHFANISTNLQAESSLVSSIDTDNLGEELDNLFDQEPSQIIDGHHFANISTNLQAESSLVSSIDTDNLGEELDNLFDQEPSQIIDGHQFANISTNLQAESSLVSSINTDNLGEELDNLFDQEPSQIIDGHQFANISTNLQAESSLVSIIDTNNLGEELDNLFDDNSFITLHDNQRQENPTFPIELETVSRSIGYDEPQLISSINSEEELDLFLEFPIVGLEEFGELSELDESELITLIESGFTDTIDADLTEQTTSSAKLIPITPAIEYPVETIKRGIQIPVPLERLDRSAQQVVDTLLTARAAIDISHQLQSQLNQLTTLTQESSQLVTKLRQLQDDYALLRNLSDEQEYSGTNVTLERYRQGYTTINRLLENILRMSELGQEIETATYQSSTRLDALDRSILRLKDGIETSRLVPFRNMTLRARAILRDLTNRYGKPAELVVQNEQIELDAGIVQQLEPALLHLLRNAYDHGLESIEQRLAAGKPAQGKIDLALNRRGNLYRLTIEDDGGGIDAALIHNIARSKGFTYDQTNTMAELLTVLCQPGFSSSSHVSEVSGRGVGMDVVVAQIASMGGKLSLATTLGDGTKFTIEIPAPQLLVPCVLLQVGDRTIAFPTDEILETALMSSMITESMNENTSLCTWLLTTNQGKVPGFDLANYWQPSQRSLPDTAICIRTRQADGTDEIWSIADELLGQAELLINPLPSPLIAPVGLLGVSLQPDGRLISILDPIALTARIATITYDESSDYSLSTLVIEQVPSSTPTILIVDDAALMRRRFEASLNTHGFITHTCTDGIEALNWLQSNPRPNLMITDVEMPNMDGFTLIDRCRQAQIDMPILVVSSRLSTEWSKEARRLGAQDYLNKGFSTSELLQKVDSLLGLVVSP